MGVGLVALLVNSGLKERELGLALDDLQGLALDDLQGLALDDLQGLFALTVADQIGIK